MTTATFDSLESCVRHWREHWSIPGIVVGLFRKGEVTLHADGISHLTADWPMRSDDLVRIASISKVFTATSAMMLVDEGNLDLDAPVKTYLPDLKLADPKAESSITMRHLLTHMSGIYGDFFDDFGSDDRALEREIAHFHTLRQYTTPGELWHYCNSGFDLAGYVIAEVAGVDYETFIRERIFEPLGLLRAGFFAHEMIAWPHAVGHEPLEPLSKEHRVADQHYPRNSNPSGAVVINAEELLRFAELHLGDGNFRGTEVLSAGSARAMRQVQAECGDFAEHWGIGWNIRDFAEGRFVYGHGGSSCGFVTQLTVLPDHDAAFCILTNSNAGHFAIRPIEAWILEHEYGLVKPAPERVELPVEQLERLAGRYSYPLGEVEICVEDGALRIRMWWPRDDSDEMIELPETLARPLSPDRFAVLDGVYEGEVMNFFPRGADRPTFLRRHGRLLERVE